MSETGADERGNVVCHTVREATYEPVHGNPKLVSAITAHVEKHIGPVGTVWHELVSDLVHVDVYHVLPTSARPCHTFVTSGMSQRRMNAPRGAAYAELMLSLPEDWPVGEIEFQDPQNSWPVNWLKRLARFPHEYKTWLGYGHTIPNGDPPQPVAPNTQFCCMLIGPSIGAPEAFWSLRRGLFKKVYFYTVYPLYLEEVELKMQADADTVLERLFEQDYSGVVNLGRENVALANQSRLETS